MLKNSQFYKTRVRVHGISHLQKKELGTDINHIMCAKNTKCLSFHKDLQWRYMRIQALLTSKICIKFLKPQKLGWTRNLSRNGNNEK